MSSGYLQISGPPERPTTLALVPVAVKEFRRHLLPLAAIFAGIALLVLAWGLLRDPTYTSSTTILVEDKNILGPLMEGRTVANDDVNRAVIANQVVVSRRIMGDILRVGGWMDDNPTPLEQDSLIDQIAGRTKVEVTDRGRARVPDPGLSLIKITYSDSDPDRAYRVTKRYGELLIAETAAAKARESRNAFEFIDSQVRRYQQTMAAAGGKLKDYRVANPDARPGADADVDSRIGELRRAVDSAQMDLIDLRSQEGQLRAQLSRESEFGGVSRSSQQRARMAELQAERDRLALTYTDAHPDVVRVEHQMRELQQQYAQGGSSRMAGTPSIIGTTASLNPLYGQLRGSLAEVRRQAAAAAARVSTAEAMLAREMARSRDIVSAEGTLSALTTDHEVNRELYQDLLRRRENARVAMSLDAGKTDFNFRIEEPARVPLRASGLRLMHFAGAGLLLAVAIPALLLTLLVKHDPRVRSPVQIERDLGLPVLGSIPVSYTRVAHAKLHRRALLAASLVLVVPLVYGVVLLLKLVGAP